VRLLYLLGPESRVEGEAMTADSGFRARYATSFDRVAVVSDEDWIRPVLRALSFLLPGKARGSSVRELEHAKEWSAAVRLMQATSDPMLGWIRVKDRVGIKRDVYVRQCWDAKGSALIDAMKPKTVRVYAQLCAGILARAHARSGDAVAISSYLGRSDKFDRGLATFAETYADQNERDYASLKAAADAGQIEVQSLS
jgi:hypothetical protein